MNQFEQKFRVVIEIKGNIGERRMGKLTIFKVELGMRISKIADFSFLCNES